MGKVKEKYIQLQEERMYRESVNRLYENDEIDESELLDWLFGGRY